jgi:hypothetical protein
VVFKLERLTSLDLPDDVTAVSLDVLAATGRQEGQVTPLLQQPCGHCRRRKRKIMPSPVSSLAMLLLSIASSVQVTAFAFHSTDVLRQGFTNLAAHHSREPSSSERKNELSHLAVAASIALTLAVSPFPAFADGAY